MEGPPQCQRKDGRESARPSVSSCLLKVDPAGHTQVAAAVRFQLSCVAVNADAGLDHLHAGRRHPAPLGPGAVAAAKPAPGDDGE